MDLDLSELLPFCQALVRFPSFPGQEGDAARLAAGHMAALGYDSVEVDACGNVIGVAAGAGAGPTLLFDGHMDVVPVPDLDAWEHAPFGGETSGGWLWGRGASDTKGSLAAMITAAGRLPRAALRGRLVVVASVCEETLTGAAIAPLLDRFRPDVFVTGEPTGLRLATAQKGRFSLTLAAHGRSAHTSRPELGDNAAYKMIAAISRLRSLPQPIDPDLGPGLLELTEIVSEPRPGTSFVPHYCIARLIGRILPGETREGLLAQLHAALSGLSGLDLALARLEQVCYTGARLELEDFLPGWRNPPGDPWPGRILAALAGAGLPAETFGAPFGTNASAAAGQRGISSFIYGPGGIEQAHSVDESLRIDNLTSAALGYATIATAVCGPT